MLGHLHKLQFDWKESKNYMYYKCIQKCKETRGCQAITFSETVTNDCWLKSSDNHAPIKTKRSFLVLACLKQPRNGVTAEYQEYVEKLGPCIEKNTCGRKQHWSGGIFFTHFFPDFECKTCSSPWIRLDNKRWYLMGNKNVPFYKAVRFCKQQGAKIAEISSNAEYFAIAKYLRGWLYKSLPSIFIS